MNTLTKDNMTTEQEEEMAIAWSKEVTWPKKCKPMPDSFRAAWTRRQSEIDALTAERDALEKLRDELATMHAVETTKRIKAEEECGKWKRAERIAAEWFLAEQSKVAELEAIIKELNEDGLLTADLKCANSGKYWYILDDVDCRRVSSLFKGGEDEREELKGIECPSPGHIIQVDQTWEDGRTYAYELSPGFWEQSEDCFLPEDWDSIRYMYSTLEAAMGGGK